MLIEFAVSNYKSIKNRQVLSMRPSGSKNQKNSLPNNLIKGSNYNLLSTIIIYGRNASGKSNFLDAFKALFSLVRESDQYKHEESIKVYKPFEFDKRYLSKPVQFELLFIASNKIKYKYKLSFNKKDIIHESLYFYPSKFPANLYKREIGNFITYGDHYKGERKVIEKDLLNNQLFLSKSASKNIKYLKEAYIFISTLLLSVFHDEEFDRRVMNLSKQVLMEDEEGFFCKNMKKILKAGDTNILDYEIKEQLDKSFEFPDNIPKSMKQQIMDTYKFKMSTTHKNFDGKKEIGTKVFPFDEESYGTQKLFVLSSFILAGLNNGGIVIVDELDKSLHPLLTRMMIKLFYSKKNNPRNAQLIFATHDVSLLNSELFRRDQVLFVDKNYDGSSFLYKLSDIKGVRKDIPFDRWYLSGRFSAIPVIEDLELDFVD